ncbi:helix-turn-helix transcriptional regulator [uncultured Desulfobacter sp.]|uniref:helix-turn-helix transcriptional regulator n=1 Tax=uncultured Desulfobacter sp. TaxID=240139 RepID=UPI0029F4EB3D|nr:helix-turn-helix transcriptional regulator [uncultured Desulfobacter sp.]
MSSNKQEYIEYHPPSDLKQYLYCYWSYQTELQKDSVKNKAIIPDGCIDIIFDLNIPTQSQCFIVGAMTKPIKSNKNNLFGVRLKPGMASSFQKMPINILTDQLVDISKINGRKTSIIAEKLVNATDYQKQTRIISNVLKRVFPSKPIIEEETQTAIDIIQNSGGTINIHQVAEKVAWSRQHLSRKFIQHTGLTPKFFASVVRVRNFIQKYKTGSSGFAEIAQECGYYDQSHMISEFKCMTGMTPQAYLKKP